MRYYPFSEERREKWIAEGRGTGSEKDWRPWLLRGDFPSAGKATVDPVFASGREMHFFSNLERNHFLVYRLGKHVRWVKDQVPWDREESRKIAKDIGVQHPRDTNTGVDIVITTDLIVQVEVPGKPLLQLPRSVKPSFKYNNHNQMEHAEIERRLAERRGYALKMLSENSLGPPVLLRNAGKLYMHRDLDRRPFALAYAGALEAVSEEVYGEIVRSGNSNSRLFAFCARLNEDRGWPPGLATSVALFLIDQHRIVLNPCNHLLDNYPISEISAHTKQMASLAREARAA